MSAEPLTVLLVAASTSTTGGGERHVADLLRGLPSRGVSVALACPAGGDLPAIAHGLGVPVHEVATAGSSPAGLTDLRRAIAAEAPDVVHANGTRAAMYARLADRRAAQRVVYSVHGIHVDRAGSALRRTSFLAVERWLRSRTAHFITGCASDVAKGDRLRVLDPARTTVVYNGIELPAPRPARGVLRGEVGLAADAPLVVCLGRFHEQKDHATLLRAWSRLVRVRPDATLVLIGSGPLESSVRALARELIPGDSVRFLAPRHDLPAVYADADVLALTSLWEGLPYVVIEALAAGLPVVATRVDGIPEAVVDGESGLLVEPGDAAAVADALAMLLGDAEMRTRFGEAGAAFVARRFTIPRMIDGVLGAYRAVTDGAGAMPQ